MFVPHHLGIRAKSYSFSILPQNPNFHKIFFPPPKLSQNLKTLDLENKKERNPKKNHCSSSTVHGVLFTRIVRGLMFTQHYSCNPIHCIAQPESGVRFRLVQSSIRVSSELLDAWLSSGGTGKISQRLNSRSDLHKSVFGAGIVLAVEDQRFRPYF